MKILFKLSKYLFLNLSYIIKIQCYILDINLTIIFQIIISEYQINFNTDGCKVIKIIAAAIFIIYLFYEFVSFLNYNLSFRSILAIIDQLGIIAIILLFIYSYKKGNNDLRIVSVVTIILVWIIGFFLSIINLAFYEEEFEDFIFLMHIRAFLITCYIPIFFYKIFKNFFILTFQSIKYY